MLSAIEPKFCRNHQPGVFIGHWYAHDIYVILTSAQPPFVIARHGNGVLDYTSGPSVTLDAASFTASAWVEIEADSAAPGWGRFMEGITSRWPDRHEDEIDDETGRVRVYVP